MSSDRQSEQCTEVLNFLNFPVEKAEEETIYKNKPKIITIIEYEYNTLPGKGNRKSTKVGYFFFFLMIKNSFKHIYNYICNRS